jgi:hypothetical protein
VEKATGDLQSSHMAIPETCNDRASGIWRKINPQRQAKGEIKRNAGCEPNGGRIHFPVPYFLALLSVAGPCSKCNLGYENGSVKP